MGTRIHATPVAAVPIIPTALARNLSGPLRLSEIQGAPKCGYVTIKITTFATACLEVRRIWICVKTILTEEENHFLSHYMYNTCTCILDFVQINYGEI